MSGKAKKPRGRPFPKGSSGNPGGRPKANPEVVAALEAGNLEQLKNLWRHTYSKNERIALTATIAWLAKSLPDARVLELSGPGGGPIPIQQMRDRLAEKLVKLLGLGEQAQAKPVELEVNAAPAPKVLEGG